MVADVNGNDPLGLKLVLPIGSSSERGFAGGTDTVVFAIELFYLKYKSYSTMQ